ncbi:poly [ADP-ribose] polymerase tankyrase-1-like [Diorhabda sublineata]|uniref:poly [ADP-ribose] polymerase tankyrase-1-like n=1 Tax=Diorhabda sublineata TaxID=1163346 RepID=UPI0024E11777|nr:poly [ADP-ribose] polymerase tankyrase-1-like [Diorhabda sublineata]
MLEDFPLHKAIVENDDDSVELLLNYVDINEKNKWGHTPVSLAIVKKNLKIVRLLLDNGAKTSILIEKFYPIHLAVKIGSLPIFKLLLEYKVNLHVNTACLSHCIHLAARYGKLEILEYILELGVDVDLFDGSKYTPLHRAIFAGKTEAVKFLLQRNADISITDNHGNTALHFAVILGMTTITQVLIAHGANIVKKNYSRLTPLDFASIHGRFDIVKCLYEAGAGCNTSGKCTYSPLHLATQYGHVEIVEYFLNKGFDINFATRNGYTMLHAATRNNHPRLVLLLIDRGADLRCTTKTKNYSALDFAALSGNPSSINILIQNCANFEVKSNGECRLINLISKNFDDTLPQVQQQKFRAATEIIIKFLVLRNRHAPVYFPERIPFLKELEQFWYDCKQEMEILDKIYIGNTTISQYQLLKALLFDKQLEKYIKNEELSIIYSNLQAHIKIPSIFENINRLIRVGVSRGKTRNIIAKCAHSIITEKIKNKLPLEIVMQIIDYLTTEDMAHLVKLDIKCAFQI